MKKEKAIKQKVRHYLDGIYCKSEVTELLKNMQNPEMQNIIEEVADELWELCIRDRPFTHFSVTICYILTNTTTGHIVRQSDIIVPVGNTPDFSLSFNELSEGKYELSVWGNITKEIPLGILHQNGLEHTDIYTGYARLTILSQNQEQTLELERAKGKLVIFCRNFPTKVAQMSLKLSPVYQSTDALLNYQGSANIQKTTGAQAINETFVAQMCIRDRPKSATPVATD